MKSLIVTSMLLGLMSTAVAESKYQKRRSNQKSRIQNGIENGSLTKKEAKKLRQGQKKVRERAKEYRADGELTKAERKSLNRAQNRQSKRIYNKKHN